MSEYTKKIKEKIENKDLKYTILTFGCQLNENDSEKMSGMLCEMGYTETEDYKKADIIIFNTCCVRENAEERLFGKVGEIKALKEEKNVIIAIGGCMMQESHMVDKIRKSYPFVDIIFGTHTIQNLPENIYKAIEKNEKIKDVIDTDGEIYEGLPIKRTNQFKASITIMYGCNNFCTYCIVPYVRGRERSRKPEDIISEISELAKEGYKEITLLGQNVNSYNGKGNVKFPILLQEICKIDGIEIIRFISSHPKDFSDELIKTIAKNNKISRIIHLPLQSGSTKVLKEMNRKYTKEDYLKLIEKIKIKIPEAVFSTDIIVGFPGESNKDFEDTLDVVKKVNFEQIFMFIYSKRDGTVASKREDKISEDIKHERFERLKDLYELNVDKNNQKYIETIQKVLIEGKSKNDKANFTGRTDTNKVVVFRPVGDEKQGDVINIKIVSAHKWYLKGEI